MRTQTAAPRVVVIGGGTGTANLLRELKKHTDNISAIVNMCDDGGSSGKLRKELGVMPPGDIRQCLTALSNNSALSKFYNTRIKSGVQAGHPPGNLILAELEQEYGSFEQAVCAVAKLLDITGQVLPVTLEPHALVMDDAEKVEGESNIEHRKFRTKQPTLSLSPAISINPQAKAALQTADIIVIAPGNLYGSLLPTLAVSGVKEAIKDSPAPVLMIANLLNKIGQTDDWHVADYVSAVQQYIGTDCLDYVLYNRGVPPKKRLELYKTFGMQPVRIDSERFKQITARAIGDDLLAHSETTIDKSDTLATKPRNFVRHNAEVAVPIIMRLARRQSA